MMALQAKKGRIEKIVIVAQQPLDAWNCKRFGIQLLQDAGFMVEYWDLSPILEPNSAPHSAAAQFRHPSIVVLTTIGELQKRFDALDSKSFIFSFVSYTADLRSIRLFRMMSRTAVGYSLFMVMPIPEKNESDEKFTNTVLHLTKKLMRHINLLPKKVLKSFVLSRLPFSWLGIRPARLVVLASDKCIINSFPCDEKTEFLNCHTFDYDFYMEEMAREARPEQPIAVFLDQYIPFHPDWHFMGFTAQIDAGPYFKYLNNFFDLVEEKLGVKVVIAAHPRSNYDEMPDYFNGRTCVRGMTAELISQSRLVIANHSAAINLANLFYKPIIFITSQEMDARNFKKFVHAMAGLHEKKPIYIDSAFTIDWDGELKVDRAAYDDYRRSYIKSDGSPELPFWEIVAKRVRDI